MGPATVGTAIGAATVTVGRSALSAVGNGLSFLAQLANATSGAESSKSDGQSADADRGFKLRCDELRQRIVKQLAALGIRLSEPVELMSNDRGGIAVAGAHPQEQAIQAALESDVLLERDFSQVAGETTGFVIAVPAGG